MKIVQDEWARVRGRVTDRVTTDLVEPLAEVTKVLKEQIFNENHRQDVLAVVGKAIPSLENHTDVHEVLGEDIRSIFGDLLSVLWVHRH